MNQPFIPPAEVAEDVRAALAEDIGTGILTALMIEPTQQARGHVIARVPILCGQPWFDEAFKQVDPKRYDYLARQKATASRPNQVLVEMHGAARSLVTANAPPELLQLLSGTATTVNTYIASHRRHENPSLTRAKPYQVCVWRKNTPCASAAARTTASVYTTAFLIKENHIATAVASTAALKDAYAIVARRCRRASRLRSSN